MDNKTYTFCSILPANYSTPYWYISEFDVKQGECVIIPIRAENNEKVGLVLEVRECSYDNAPYYPEHTKKVIRHYKSNENANFDKEYQILEKNIYIITDIQQKKLDIKKALNRNNVDNKKILDSQMAIKELFKNNEVLNSKTSFGTLDLFGGIVLSEDGKSVTGYRTIKGKSEDCICIPAGVKTVEDNALLLVNFKSLYIPKELEGLGKCTLTNFNSRDEWGYAKDIEKIEVEEGNPYFYTDNIALYSITNGKKRLERVFDTKIVDYKAPNDVISYAPLAFDRCYELENIILSDDTEEFNEYSLPENTKVTEIYIPKNCKDIITAPPKGGEKLYQYDIYYLIAEDNKNLFRDEDSIYKVLEDGTYKLVLNSYRGKGKPLILDGTSVIGEYAFQNNENLTKILFPKSLKQIWKYAFEHTGIKSLNVPSHVKVINEYAFRCCSELKKVKLSEQLEYIDETAFTNNYQLEKIESDSKTTVFSLTNGLVRCTDAKKTQTKEDGFLKFVELITYVIERDSRENRNAINDKAFFDNKSRIVTIDVALVQYSQSDEKVAERVQAVEKLAVGDSLSVKTRNDDMEFFDNDGNSVGTYYVSYLLEPYLKYIDVDKICVSSVTPKSQRRGNAKYALISVEILIKERKMLTDFFEDENNICSDYSYVIKNNEVRLIQWHGELEAHKLTIPQTIEKLPVVSVEKDCFEKALSCSPENTIHTLVIPEGVKRLESDALNHLRNAKIIILPASINYISENVFSSYRGEYKDIYLNENLIFVAPCGSYAETFLKSYKPHSYGVKFLTVVNDDSEDTDNKCKMLSAFHFDSIGGDFIAQFKEDYKLKDFKEDVVEIPEKMNGQAVTSFDLFGIPNFVQKLIIPASVTHFANIDRHIVFYNHGNNLRTVEIADDNPNYWSDGYAIFSKDRKVLFRFLSYVTKEYTIPAGTEVIATYAFAKCENLEKLTLPESINRIEKYAFCECIKLAEINGMEYVSEVGEKIFSGDITGDSIPFEQKTPILIIGSSLLRYNELSQCIVKVPEGITKICASAFGCKNENDQVEEIVLPNSVKTIESAAFYGRKQLKRINIPDGVKEIPSSTFAYCENLERIYIPASVEKIEISAFPTYSAGGVYAKEQKCALTTIEVDKDNKNYCSVNGMLLSKDKTELLFIPNCVQNFDFEIPTGVTEISNSVALSNMALTELVLPYSLAKIGKSAFSNCENLERVVFPEKLEAIGEYAFSGCKNLKTIVWPKNLKRIGDSSFKETGLKEITLPDTLEYIGSQAFAQTAIERVTVPKSVRTLGWGAFSCVPVIEVYDSIDPDAQDADKAIDIANGNPNSMVGYIGMGPAWAMWQCAANHRWVNYTIVVRSSDTNEIKYKVWMGADDSQRDYYCFLSSAWGHNATFAFSSLDEFFPKIRGKENKVQVAKFRLKYPTELSENAKLKYESYVKKYS